MSRNGGIWKRPRASTTGTKGVIEIDMVSAVRRWRRRVMGIDELAGVLEVDDEGRDEWCERRGAVVEE